MLDMNNSYPKNRWFIQGIWIIVQAFQFYLPFAIAPLLTTIMSEYNLSYSSAGALITVVAVIGGIAMFGGDVVIRKLGMKNGATLMLIFFLLGSILSAVAGSYLVLMIGRILIGLGFGLLRAITGAKTILWFPRKEQAYINTCDTVVETAAQSVAFAFTIPIVVMVGNWHNIFTYCSIAIGIILVIWLIFGKEAPYTTGEVNLNTTADKKKKGSLSVIWMKKEVRNLTYASIGMFMTFTAVATFGPTFLEQARGYSAENAAYMTSGLPIAGLLGSLLIGSLSGITMLRRPFMWPMIVLSLIGMVTFSLATNPFLIVLGVCAVGFGISAYIPLIFTFLMDLPDMKPEMVAAGIALTIGVSQIFTLGTSYIFDALVPLLNLSGAFMFFGVFLVISLIFSLMLPETGPGRNKKNSVHESGNNEKNREEVSKVEVV